MTDHYFSNDPEVKSEPIKWNYQLRGENLSFTSDYGVFSRKEVDFGSRVLIESFQEPDVLGDFLDVGCGYGPIGISLAKAFPDREVYMIDVNKRALSLTEKNAEDNNVSNINVLESNLFENVTHHQFAAILSNPPIRAGKQVVHSILEQSYKYLVSGGDLWVVIQKKQGAPSAKKKLEEVFEEVEVVNREKGYFIFKACKR